MKCQQVSAMFFITTNVTIYSHPATPSSLQLVHVRHHSAITASCLYLFLAYSSCIPPKGHFYHCTGWFYLENTKVNGSLSLWTPRPRPGTLEAMACLAFAAFMASVTFQACPYQCIRLSRTHGFPKYWSFMFFHLFFFLCSVVLLFAHLLPFAFWAFLVYASLSVEYF